MTAEPATQIEPARSTAGFRPGLKHIFATSFFAAQILATVAPLGLAPIFAVATVGALLLYLWGRRRWPWPTRNLLITGLRFRQIVNRL